ncbi:unnamed protein product [Pleuronectes platessa]|uniref:Uncharacterized protein n=1 Tax=Pleuronectes platessa TaxID=8262 RepID=A0A9N7U1T1_PLEPL|nr:unnamed protein product [Pleuronectes platessa]
MAPLQTNWILVQFDPDPEHLVWSEEHLTPDAMFLTLGPNQTRPEDKLVREDMRPDLSIRASDTSMLMEDKIASCHLFFLPLLSILCPTTFSLFPVSVSLAVDE